MKSKLYTGPEFLAASFSSAEPLVEGGFLARGQQALLVAPEKSGKTILSLQLMTALAAAQPFLGFSVPVPRKVLYFAMEGTDFDIQEAWQRILRAQDIPSDAMQKAALVRLPFLPLHDPQTTASIESYLKADSPDLLVIDPLYKAVRGSVTDDNVIRELTDRLGALSMQYGHATWLIHHEHRPRTDQQGMRYESKRQRYAGSYVLGAWPDVSYGLDFNLKDQTATLTFNFGRRRGDLDMRLTLLDEPDKLLFVPEASAFILSDIKALAGLNIREIARRYDIHVESARRVLTKMVKSGKIRLTQKGRESVVEVSDGS